MDIANYLDAIGISESSTTALEELTKLCESAYQNLKSSSEQFKESIATKKLADFDAAEYEYLIPKLSPDGSCSLIGDLEETPFSLETVLGARTEDTAKYIHLMRYLVEIANKEVAADWFGIYQRFTLSDETDALVKLAYQGLESRAVFPLTEEFAKKSNNSSIGLTGKLILVDDVNQHTEAGNPYYTCDLSVKSEICVPVLDDQGTAVTGIIDAESAQPKFFSAPDKQANVFALALLLTEFFKL